MKHKDMELVYFRSAKTIDEWTGGKYYDYWFSIQLFGTKIVFWKVKEK